MFINYFFADSVIVHGDWFGVDHFQFVGVSRLVGQYEGWHLKLVKAS